MQLKHKARKKHGGDGVERLAVNLPAPVREFIYEPPVAPSIWPRRLFHLAAGLSLPAAILVVPDHIMQWVLVAASLAAILLELSRGLVPTANDWVFTWLPLFKSQERYQVTGATFLILGATAAYFAFDNEIVRAGARLPRGRRPAGGAGGPPRPPPPYLREVCRGQRGVRRRAPSRLAPSSRCTRTSRSRGGSSPERSRPRWLNSCPSPSTTT